MTRYKVYKKGRRKWNFWGTISGKSPKIAFKKHSRAGDFTKGDFMVESKRGELLRFRF